MPDQTEKTAAEIVSLATLDGGIDRTHADSLEVVISRDRVWINEDGVNVARWYNIKNLSVRDLRTPAAA
jgi:hypothetical protein